MWCWFFPSFLRISMWVKFQSPKSWVVIFHKIIGRKVQMSCKATKSVCNSDVNIKSHIYDLVVYAAEIVLIDLVLCFLENFFIFKNHFFAKNNIFQNQNFKEKKRYHFEWARSFTHGELLTIFFIGTPIRRALRI